MATFKIASPASPGVPQDHGDASPSPHRGDASRVTSPDVPRGGREGDTDTEPLCATVGGDLWVSENRHDRAHAAALCRTCPMLDRCHQEAEDLRTRPYDTRDDRDSTFRPWGIWAGLSYRGSTAPPHPVKPPAEPRHRTRRRAA